MMITDPVAPGAEKSSRNFLSAMEICPGPIIGMCYPDSRFVLDPAEEFPIRIGNSRSRGACTSACGRMTPENFRIDPEICRGLRIGISYPGRKFPTMWRVDERM